MKCKKREKGKKGALYISLTALIALALLAHSNNNLGVSVIIGGIEIDNETYPEGVYYAYTAEAPSRISPPSYSTAFRTTVNAYFPEKIILGKNERMEIPITIVNDEKYIIRQLWITAETDPQIIATPKQAYFETIGLGERRTANFVIESKDIEGDYNIKFVIHSDSPSIDQIALAEIRVSEERLTAEEQAKKTEEAEKQTEEAYNMLKENPECSEFEVMINQAKEALDQKHPIKAISLLDQYTKNCKRRIYEEKYGRIEKPSARTEIIPAIIVLVEAIIATSLIMAGIGSLEILVNFRRIMLIRAIKSEGMRIVGLEKKTLKELSRIAKDIKKKRHLKRKKIPKPKKHKKR